MKVLDISNNGVNNDGAACLSKALVQNRTLEELNLNGNRVGLVGTTNIFKSLCTNDCLCTLRVSEMRFTTRLVVVAPIVSEGVYVWFLFSSTVFRVLFSFAISRTCLFP